MYNQKYFIYALLFCSILVTIFIKLNDSFAKSTNTALTESSNLFYQSNKKPILQTALEKNSKPNQIENVNNFKAYNSFAINAIINKMTLPEMVGQMFFVSIPDRIPSQRLANFLNTYHIGGVILFSNNIQNILQTKTLTKFIQQSESPISNYRIKLFIGTDQEGGLVNRLKPILPMQYTLSEYQMGQLYYNNIYDAKIIYNHIGRVMKYLGINLNFAPEVDIAYNKKGFINKEMRSYSDNPLIVTELSQAAIRGYHEAGVITCLKHFAGLGRASSNPQYTPPIIDESYYTLYNTDWQPYIKAINSHNADMIMISHGIYPELDSRYPASLSYKITTGILRDKLHYKGVIITDDLTMGALRNYGNIGQRAIYAINAGSDIVLICSNYQIIKNAYYAVLKAIETNKIPRKRIIDSVKRILMLKIKYGLVTNQ